MKKHEDLEKSLRLYLLLLEREAYFEAHEVLEEIWHPMRKAGDPLQNLVKGLINAAVAFEHLKRAKPGAAQRAQRVMRSFDRHRYLCPKGRRETELFMDACRKVEVIWRSKKEIFDVFVPWADAAQP